MAVQVPGIGDLLKRNDGGPHRAEAGVRLPHGELRYRTRQLDGALGQVVADGEAGHVVPPVGLGCPLRAPADDHHELHLVVDPAAWQGDRGFRPGVAGRELGEDHRFRRQHRHPGLLGVVLVVQSDAEDLAGQRHGGTEARRVVRRGGRGGGRGEASDLVPAGVDLEEVGGELAVAGAFQVDGAAAGQQHRPVLQVGKSHAMILRFRKPRVQKARVQKALVQKAAWRRSSAGSTMRCPAPEMTCPGSAAWK